MVTRRAWLEYWTETKRVLTAANGEPYVKQVTCCGTGAAGTRRECQESRSLKTPCRCHCHSTKPHRLDHGYPKGTP